MPLPSSLLCVSALLGTALLAVPMSVAYAQDAGGAGCAATETMRGGRNLYVPNAPLVRDLGQGFVVTGIVRQAGTCAPLPNVRVQIWASTERGGEGEPSNRGSVVTGADGSFRLETSPIVPNFGQAHIHMAYDDPGYGTVFLRPLLNSRYDTAIRVDMNLAPTDARNPAGS
jgi:hypothetical protein